MKLFLLTLAVLLTVIVITGCVQKLGDSAKTELAVSPLPAEKAATTPSVAETERVVLVKDNGFEPSELTINAGDTVVWKNARSGRLTTAIIQGSKQCVNIKSPLLKYGQEFRIKFSKPISCQIIEAITTDQISTIIVKDKQ